MFESKRMKNLLQVCETMLNDANVDIAIEIPTSTIILDFVVATSLENIVIYCSNYIYLKVTKSAEDDQSFFVGETNIKFITEKIKIQQLSKEKDFYIDDEQTNSPLFYVQCEGGISLEIICQTLAWKINNSKLEFLS